MISQPSPLGRSEAPGAPVRGGSSPGVRVVRLDTRPLVRVLLLAAGVLALALLARPAQADALDTQVREIGLGLRCPVCENVSVADSTSELAGQMRQVIREQVAAGKTRQQIVNYFVDRYGESVLYDPPKQGFGLLVWAGAPLGLLVGAAAVWRILRRHPAATAMAAPAAGGPSAATSAAGPHAADPETEAYRQRLRAEIGALGDVQ